MLETDPQAFLLGAGQTQADTGKPGFDETMGHTGVTK